MGRPTKYGRCETSTMLIKDGGRCDSWYCSSAGRLRCPVKAGSKIVTKRKRPAP